MQPATYFLDLNEDERQQVQRGLHTVLKLAERCKQWRRIALVSFGLFMASVIGNIVLFLGR